MAVTRCVRVERNNLRFAAAHMATFRDGCEPLHGHNYDVIVEIEGDLTEDSWVWDFSHLKRATKAIVDRLDHRFLLQRDSRVLGIVETTEQWELTFGDRRYVFPRADVAVLPIDNSTAERLAEWVTGELVEHLKRQSSATLRKLTVGIEEMPGQTGWYTVDL